MTVKYCKKFREVCPYITPAGTCYLPICQPDAPQCEHAVSSDDDVAMNKLTIRYLRTIMHQNDQILKQLQKQK